MVSFGSLLRLPLKFVAELRAKGMRAALAKAHFFLFRLSVYKYYDRWVETNDTLTARDREAIRRHIAQLPAQPKISILMPVYDPEERWLIAAIDSVRNQLYSNWELCIADDASTKAYVRRVLEEYRSMDERIKVVFRQANGHISAASNSALSLASGEFLALFDHDDVLSEQALYRVVVELSAHPDACLIYSDEDKIDETGRRYDPYFKPDWNPELFLGQNMISHLGVYRTAIVLDLGGFREGYEGSQDWDLALRVTEKMTPAQIRHIPNVLYHWRAVRGSTALNVDKKVYAVEASRRALESHFIRTKQSDVKVTPLVDGMWRILYPVPCPAPKVSLIIPTRNGYELLRLCVESIFEKTDYPNYELVIVDNQSDDPQVLEYFEQLAEHPNTRLLHYDAPFNFSAINNYAVRHTDSEIIGFLNNDLEVISSEWLDAMVSHAVRPDCGAIGAMLYYPDNRIQHAGVILGAGGFAEGYTHGIADHAYGRRRRGFPGQMNRARLTQNLSAVTAACLVVRRRVFEEVGGFDETDLKIAFNDVDLCLRIQEHGYRNVWTPFAELYHHESASRGYEDTLEKRCRFRGECKIMMDRWGDRLTTDPAYNPNLDLIAADFHWSVESRTIKPWLQTEK